MKIKNRNELPRRKQRGSSLKEDLFKVRSTLQELQKAQDNLLHD